MGFLDSALSRFEHTIETIDGTSSNGEERDSTPSAAQIDQQLPEFAHKFDKTALQAIATVPAFGKVYQTFSKHFSDRENRLQQMSTALKVGPKQCPEIYRSLPEICCFFAVPEPELYVTVDPMPNAWASGAKDHVINITTGLLDIVSEDELEAVIAHEVGHIACNHMMYMSIGRALATGAFMTVLSRIPGLNMATIATDGLKVAFDYWSRCASLSADRAAAIYFGDADPMVNAIMKLAGGNSRFAATLSVEEFKAQGEAYLNQVKESNTSKYYHYSDLMTARSPLNPVRVFELTSWTETSDFAKYRATYSLGFAHAEDYSVAV